ncbi:hypothetical protein [Staphylococcus aureus]|uniref:hypothetical protein n=1 Tax=Staphylococcus aureus TaxID=1280 RepID=UPI0020BF3C19|nr:hypothetical protein [Staphylococcus aureus]
MNARRQKKKRARELYRLMQLIDQVGIEPEIMAKRKGIFPASADTKPIAELASRLDTQIIKTTVNLQEFHHLEYAGVRVFVEVAAPVRFPASSIDPLSPYETPQAEQMIRDLTANFERRI